MIYRFGDFRLDTARQQLFRSGEPVDVEPMALDLLQYLVAQNERLVTKEELFSVLWNDRAVTESALSTCLKSARRAVEDSGSSQKIIKTVHGKGFRWIAPVSILASDVRIAEAEPVVAEAGETNSLISTGRPSIAILPFDVLGTDVTSSTLSEAITMKGYSKPVRTYAVQGIYEDEAGKGRLIHREEEGFSLTIDRARLNPETKADVIGALKSVLSELE